MSDRAQALTVNESLILERISTLLSHYWTPVETNDAKALRKRDWLDCLRKFGAPVVNLACRDWLLQNPERRPTPGHIAELAQEIERKAHPLRLARPHPPSRTEQALEAEKQRRYAEAEAHRDNFARLEGFKDFGEMMRTRWQR